ncbi:MAG: pyridoxamine 5'-phosphate oxidase family protein [Flavisolibacter sp.]
MLGILESSEIEKVLNSQIVGRIGCHADGITYIVPISYGYDGVYIYGRSLEGMKTSIMRKNPQICFEVDDMKDMANWKSVITWGVFEELDEVTERDNALKILVNRVLPLVSSETTHLSQHWPFPDQDLNNISGIVFRIRLTEKTGRFESTEGSFVAY